MELLAICRGGLVAVDRHSNQQTAPPEPRYRVLTLPKLRLGRVKSVSYFTTSTPFITIQWPGKVQR